MASFLRSLLQVLLGVVIGFAAATYLLPSGRSAGSSAPVAGPGPAAPSPAAAVHATEPSSGGSGLTLFGQRSGGQVAPGTFASTQATAKVETPRPAEPAPVVTPAPVAEAPAPPAAPALPEGPVDFRELCIKPAAWPPIITLNKEINAQVMQGEEVIAEIPLSAGERLQVSKVFGDGTAEVRAKGAKFIVKAADTDLAAQARVRLAEISGRVRAPVPVAVSPVAEPGPAPKEPKETPPPPRRDDLDTKMRSLFGTPEKR